jgi:hypothetical protein
MRPGLRRPRSNDATACHYRRSASRVRCHRRDVFSRRSACCGCPSGQKCPTGSQPRYGSGRTSGSRQPADENCGASCLKSAPVRAAGQCRSPCGGVGAKAQSGNCPSRTILACWRTTNGGWRWGGQRTTTTSSHWLVSRQCSWSRWIAIQSHQGHRCGALPATASAVESTDFSIRWPERQQCCEPLGTTRRTALSGHQAR